MFKSIEARLFAWVLAIFAVTNCARAYEPTTNYETREIEGWTVRVNKALLKDETLSSNVLKLLDFQLYQITRVVPTPALARLKEVTIWTELNDPKFPGMCYHPSPEWLREHDFNPQKAQGVEIANAHNFLTWTKEQPWMVLHELAHSYHHRVLGYDNPEIKAAYQRAVESKTYESVRHINGRMQRHYALNNDQEYFAECSEAFFGVNDFYPFVRAELREFDPGMFAVLEKVWGTKPARTPSTNQAPASLSAPTNSAR